MSKPSLRHDTIVAVHEFSARVGGRPRDDMARLVIREAARAGLLNDDEEAACLAAVDFREAAAAALAVRPPPDPNRGVPPAHEFCAPGIARAVLAWRWASEDARPADARAAGLVALARAVAQLSLGWTRPVDLDEALLRLIQASPDAEAVGL